LAYRMLTRSGYSLPTKSSHVNQRSVAGWESPSTKDLRLITTKLSRQLGVLAHVCVFGVHRLLLIVAGTELRRETALQRRVP